MREMMYEFIAIAVVALLITTYYIGSNSDSMQGNMSALAKSNTAVVKDISDK